MTFSIAKSCLAVLAGIALGDGLISDIDAPVAETVPGDYFASAHNSDITWRHLLNQTSEWEGTLWDKPDLVDRNRQVGPGSDNSCKGEHRDLQAPGTYWEYNDVRVNLPTQVYRDGIKAGIANIAINGNFYSLFKV